MDRVQEAARLMSAFAERTGLTSQAAQRRYLWTDAFAVGNFLGLAQRTGDVMHRAWALRLVDAVHHTLGRHRLDDPRRGWISGLGEKEGEAHPTRGGLRIGKSLPERRPDEPFDEALEWERDGQYFHYLTKWMQALDLAARETKTPRFNLWARELAQTACAAFARGRSGSGRPGLVWKMSIDLSRPLVASTGQHDALDGFVACTELRATAASLAVANEGPSLGDEIAHLETLLDPRFFATSDPLGLGGLLLDAARLDRLSGPARRDFGMLTGALLGAVAEGLELYARQGELKRKAAHRLAFRELGLALGLHALALLGKAPPPSLRPFTSLGAEIEAFWLEPANRAEAAWTEHRDINEVMLATSLLPEGWLA